MYTPGLAKSTNFLTLIGIGLGFGLGSLLVYKLYYKFFGNANEPAEPIFRRRRIRLIKKPNSKTFSPNLRNRMGNQQTGHSPSLDHTYYNTEHGVRISRFYYSGKEYQSVSTVGSPDRPVKRHEETPTVPTNTPVHRAKERGGSFNRNDSFEFVNVDDAGFQDGDNEEQFIMYEGLPGSQIKAILPSSLDNHRDIAFIDEDGLNSYDFLTDFNETQISNRSTPKPEKPKTLALCGSFEDESAYRLPFRRKPLKYDTESPGEHSMIANFSPVSLNERSSKLWSNSSDNSNSLGKDSAFLSMDTQKTDSLTTSKERNLNLIVPSVLDTKNTNAEDTLKVEAPKSPMSPGVKRVQFREDSWTDLDRLTKRRGGSIHAVSRDDYLSSSPCTPETPGSDAKFPRNFSLDLSDLSMDMDTPESEFFEIDFVGIKTSRSIESLQRELDTVKQEMEILDEELTEMDIRTGVNVASEGPEKVRERREIAHVFEVLHKFRSRIPPTPSPKRDRSLSTSIESIDEQSEPGENSPLLSRAHSSGNVKPILDPLAKWEGFTFNDIDETALHHARKLLEESPVHKSRYRNNSGSTKNSGKNEFQVQMNEEELKITLYERDNTSSKEPVKFGLNEESDDDDDCDNLDNQCDELSNNNMDKLLYSQLEKPYLNLKQGTSVLDNDKHVMASGIQHGLKPSQAGNMDMSNITSTNFNMENKTKVLSNSSCEENPEKIEMQDLAHPLEMKNDSAKNNDVVNSPAGWEKHEDENKQNCSQESSPSVNGIKNIGSRHDIMHYAEKEWRGGTDRAEMIKKGYNEICHRLGFGHLRCIRGDNYCAIRGAVYQVLVNAIPVINHVGELEKILGRLDQYISGNHSYLASNWSFANRLPAFQSATACQEMMHKCIKTFFEQVKAVADFKTFEERESFVISNLNQHGSSLDFEIMEAVKLLMMLTAIQLYEDYNNGGDVPVFVWLLFARDTSETPRDLLKNHLNGVGDSAGLEQIEMFLLGYALGVTLQVIQPSHHGKEDFITHYPDDMVEKFPKICLIAEDDRHYNVVV